MRKPGEQWKRKGGGYVPSEAARDDAPVCGRGVPMVARGDPKGLSIVNLPNQEAEGYGPLGTPNRYRAERIARSQREDALRYRAAAQRLALNADPSDSGELRALRLETRWLRDQNGDLRRGQQQLHETILRLQAQLMRLQDQMDALRHDTIEAIAYLDDTMEVSHNGRAAPNS
jgi:hypothetical protein